MNTQDNEFDNLFRSKLDGFETEPSVNVWQNIDAGLHAGNRRGLLVPLLSAAASIIVLVTAGVLLIPHQVKDRNDHHGKSNIAKSDVPVKTVAVVQTKRPMEIAGKNTSITTNPVKHVTAMQQAKKQLITQQPATTGTMANQRATAKQQAPEVIAAVPQKHDEIVQPQPADTMALAVNTANTPDVKPVQAVVPDKQVIAKAAPQISKRHRIHSLGDMLNTVIAAVDKRKDKLIEFTDTDDDESVITGVNLGIVAVKKQN